MKTWNFIYNVYEQMNDTKNIKSKTFSISSHSVKQQDKTAC